MCCQALDHTLCHFGWGQDGLTALFFAVKSGANEVVRLLVEKSANVNSNTWKYALLSGAAERGDNECVWLLLQNDKLDLNMKDSVSNDHSSKAMLLEESQLVILWPILHAGTHRQTHTHSCVLA